MKMNISKYVGMCALAIAFTACNPGEFGDMNVDPNNTSNPQPALVFTSAMRAISGTRKIACRPCSNTSAIACK